MCFFLDVSMDNAIGTPFTNSATRVLLCGSGELGKEVVIELQRFGVEVIALDAYSNAPAMQVADRSHVVSMLDGEALREIILHEKPNLVIPEVEAIATDVLAQLEAQGETKIVPTARATQLTMNREGIRRLAAEELGLKTSSFKFAETEEEFKMAVSAVGIPCVVKPIMSSSGKGQSTIKREEEIMPAWDHAQAGGRAGRGKVIVEGFVEFDYEITQLTVRHTGGTSFCDPIGHVQVEGDYRQSWQPQPMSAGAKQESRKYAEKITTALGGYGIFGVELFIRGDEVLFSEVSPRPHDTGMVTMISQDLSQFALHARAVLGLPIPSVRQFGPSASSVILVEGNSREVIFGNLNQTLLEDDVQLRLFGKPEVKGQRRMGVALARGDSIENAKEKAMKASSSVSISLM